jgi:hypothetical protein
VHIPMLRSYARPGIGLTWQILAWDQKRCQRLLVHGPPMKTQLRLSCTAPLLARRHGRVRVLHPTVGLLADAACSVLICIWQSLLQKRACLGEHQEHGYSLARKCVSNRHPIVPILFRNLKLWSSRLAYSNYKLNIPADILWPHSIIGLPGGYSCSRGRKCG